MGAADIDVVLRFCGTTDVLTPMLIAVDICHRCRLAEDLYETIESGKRVSDPRYSKYFSYDN